MCEFREVLTISSEVVTVVGGFGLLFWYIQKRIENKSSDARRALDELFEVEKWIEILIAGVDKDRYIALSELLVALQKLNSTLEILEVFRERESIDQIIKILSSNKAGYPQKISEEIEEIVERDDKDRNKLYQLKNLLKKLYNIRW